MRFKTLRSPAKHKFKNHFGKINNDTLEKTQQFQLV